MTGSRGRRPWAFAGATVAAVIFAAGCNGGGGEYKTYTDEAGWSVTYPSRMHLERSEVRSWVYVHEVTIATFTPRRPIRTGGNAHGGWLGVDPPRPEHGGFPPDGVAFRIHFQAGGPAPTLESGESKFPLDLRRFRPSSSYRFWAPKAVGQGIAANGQTYRAFAWVGPKASARSRADLAQVVSSVSFPTLRPGTVVGDGFSVLPVASRYPVGSFTRVRAQGEPFYLVHAPGGFYAIGWRWQSLSGGYKSHCRLAFDPGPKEFFCGNLRVRWDRIGRPLVVPFDWVQPDPLNVAVAKTARDGHVLLHPGTARFAGARFAARLWPHWHPAR